MIDKKENKMMKKTILSLALALMIAAPHAYAGGGEMPELKHQHWHFSGITGQFDKAALQRGLKVYREVCSACHSLKRVAYRNLADLGYDENQIKNIAAEYTVTDGPNDEGEMFDRPARPSDPFVSPYPNDKAAKALNDGAMPPDLSLITKARHHGPDYVYSLLLGYETGEESHADEAHGDEHEDAAAASKVKVIHGIEIPEGKHYNAYYPGHVISMAAPLSDDMVMYEDETPMTAEQYAYDVVNFLTWAADPYLETRKRTGIAVLIFLIAFAGVMYAVKKKIWADVKK